jgi:DNA polymerase-1
MTSPHLLIVDAQSLAGRAASVAEGDPVGGARLWCQMVRGAAMDLEATHVIAAWDHDGPTFRHVLFPSYKHRRTGTMRQRIAPIREVVESTGITSVSVAEFEGDDCVASLLAQFRSTARVTLLSNDSDLLQFVADDVTVATYVGVGKGPRGMRVKPWTADDVQTRFGVTPALLPAFKALCGEVGDDIPGVPNIGKETAIKLLRRWRSLEKAVEASEFVSHRDLTARLAGQQAQVQLMLQLTTIRQDAPLPPLSLSQCAAALIAWPGRSAARSAVPSSEAVTRSAAGPGLDDVPFPTE